VHGSSVQIAGRNYNDGFNSHINAPPAHARVKINSFSCGYFPERPHVVGIKTDHSLFGMLGKLFFRRQQAWVQRRKITVLLWSVFVGLLCGGALMAVIFLAGKR